MTVKRCSGFLHCPGRLKRGAGFIFRPDHHHNPTADNQNPAHYAGTPGNLSPVAVPAFFVAPESSREPARGCNRNRSPEPGTLKTDTTPRERIRQRLTAWNSGRGKHRTTRNPIAKRCAKCRKPRERETMPEPADCLAFLPAIFVQPKWRSEPDCQDATGEISSKKFPAYSGVRFRNVVLLKHIFENTPTPSSFFFAARFRSRKLADPSERFSLTPATMAGALEARQ